MARYCKAAYAVSWAKFLLKTKSFRLTGIYVNGKCYRVCRHISNIRAHDNARALKKAYPLFGLQQWKTQQAVNNNHANDGH